MDTCGTAVRETFPFDWKTSLRPSCLSRGEISHERPWALGATSSTMPLLLAPELPSTGLLVKRTLQR